MNTHEYKSDIYEFLWIRYEIHELYEYEFGEMLFHMNRMNLWMKKGDVFLFSPFFFFLPLKN